MGTELVRASDVNIDELKRLGQMMALCGYFEKSPNEAQAVAQMAVKVLAGREMGYGPFASANGIHIIKGKPAVSANLMAAAVKASALYDYRVRKMDATICEIEFFERTASGKESLGVSSFTADEARKAGTQNMDKFPRNMLFARAMSNGVKWYCPDVFNGNAVYVPEELGATVDGEGNVIDSTASIVTVVTPANGGANGTVASGSAKHSAPGEGITSEAPTGKPVLGIVSPGTLRRLHAVGVSAYGQTEWDAKRHAIVKAITKGRAESSKELYEAEAQRLISGIEEKMRQEGTSQPEPDGEPDELAPVSLDEVQEMAF